MAQIFGSKGWTPERIGNLQGKTYVITGGNSGLGLDASKLLTSKGARVIILCRNPIKANLAIEDIKSTITGAKVEFIPLDLMSLSSVKQSAEEVRSVCDSIDALILNAGIMMTPTQKRTEDGFESQLGVNHYGHFALAGQLFDLVEKAAGRFVPVSSIAHKMGVRSMQFDDLDFDHNYGGFSVYRHSKLANLLFGRELERRLRASNKKSTAVICHPGYAATNIQTAEVNSFMGAVMTLCNKIIAQSSEKGAWAEVLAACDDDAIGGAYYGPTKLNEMRGPIGECIPAKWARDDGAAAKLWEISEHKTGIKWAI
ncbi:MAG: oxidoreductase [Gammaproteobacteria bacterium]|nr:MAG: oxidoreductase [Gammaproteobacteria bacterium]